MRLGDAEDAPAPLPDAPGPIDLLAVNEEVLVEQASFFNGLAPEHHGGAQREVDVKRQRAGIQRTRVAPIEPAFYHAPGSREQLSPKLPQAGKLKGAMLKTAIGKGQAGADHADIGARQQRVKQQP